MAAVAIALCRRFQHLRVVGLEPARAPLAEARANVVAAGLQDRVELRAQRVEELADDGSEALGQEALAGLAQEAGYEEVQTVPASELQLVAARRP